LAGTGLLHVPAALFEYKPLRSVGLNMPSGDSGGEEDCLVPGIEPRLCNSCAARARNGVLPASQPNETANGGDLSEAFFLILIS